MSMEAHTGEKLGLERFTSLIAELKEADVRSVVLKGGGEPTTHPQFIEMLDVLRGRHSDFVRRHCRHPQDLRGRHHADPDRGARHAD